MECQRGTEEEKNQCIGDLVFLEDRKWKQAKETTAQSKGLWAHPGAYAHANPPGGPPSLCPSALGVQLLGLVLGCLRLLLLPHPLI